MKFNLLFTTTFWKELSKMEDIKTIAVIDLETNGLPWEQNNTCAITELSIYAFSAACLTDTHEDEIVLRLNDDMDVIEKVGVKPPELPRVLHKITMMINPVKDIDPVAAKMSGNVHLTCIKIVMC